MKINISKNGKAITSLDSWFKLAPPKGKDQWKVGRSALEMARFALSNSFSGFITQVLKECKLESLASDFDCEPEANSSFGKGMGNGGSRNHDLLMIGNDVILGVEAKVSEHFGNDTVKKWCKRPDKKGNRQKRILRLIETVSDKKYDSIEKIPNEINELRYQLFTAVVGTINEAVETGVKNAIVLTIVFDGDVEKDRNYKVKIKTNNDDFNSFAERFFPKGEKKIRGVNCQVLKKYVHIKQDYTVSSSPLE